MIKDAKVPFESLRLVDVVTHDAVGGFKSKREARDRIRAGAVRINGETLTDPEQIIAASDQPVSLELGRRRRVRIFFK